MVASRLQFSFALLCFTCTFAVWRHLHFDNPRVVGIVMNIGSPRSPQFYLFIIRNLFDSTYSILTPFLFGVSIAIQPIHVTSLFVRSCREASLLESLLTPCYICVGLPDTTFGPLFNTIVCTYNGGADSFELSNGFIWVEALLDLHKFSIKSNPPQDSDQHPFLNMQRQMGDRLLLVEAKFTFTLETSTRMKTVIQTELLEVSNIRTTSTHKPINHTIQYVNR